MCGMGELVSVKSAAYLCVIFPLSLSDNRELQRSVVRCIQFGQLAAQKTNTDILHPATALQKLSASQMKENKHEDQETKPLMVRIV